MVEEKWYHTQTYVQRFQDNIFEGGGGGGHEMYIRSPSRGVWVHSP